MRSLARRAAYHQEHNWREVADCDAKLRAHRAALEAGADPVIMGWMDGGGTGSAHRR